MAQHERCYEKMEGHEKWDGDWTQCENFVGYIHSSHTVSYSETEEHGFWSLEHKMSNVWFLSMFFALEFFICQCLPMVTMQTYTWSFQLHKSI